LPLTDRVAIFVLFQPKGIAASTFFTLSHLAQENWSVVVVSNAALSDADRTKIAKHSAQVIVRPNIGYDFGAYRDGWYWLQHRRQPVSRLIMMNDSTWFPLRADDSSLARMEQHGSDLTGHIYKFEAPRHNSNDHVESHLLMFNSSAINNTVLRMFWKKYNMTSSRAKTIERGEKGITAAIMSAGLTADGLLRRERFLSILQNLSDQDLIDAIKNFAPDDEIGKTSQQDFLRKFSENSFRRTDAISWVDHHLSGDARSAYFISSVFVDTALRYGALGFLKKSNDRIFHLARVAAMSSIAAGRIPAFAPEVMAEIQALIDKYDQSPDWRA
jgi:hypothetical protein